MIATRRLRWGTAGWVEIAVDPIPLDAAVAHYELGGMLIGMRGGLPVALLRGMGVVHPSASLMCGCEWHLVITDSWSQQPAVSKGD
ncbi:hypothetical protein [Burkholderia anthina]|uniref:hypothetical protein n=1 Tax=Burkholderia anthina TaxID=179879 RepID=UPI0037C0C04A